MAFHSVPLKAQHSNQFSTYYQLPVSSPISSREWNWPQLLCFLLAIKLNSERDSISSHLWWHGLYPLFLSLSHSWRSLRGWCGLDQTSDDACWIWTVIGSLLHGYSDSLPSSGVALCLPALPPLVPPLLLSVMSPMWFFSVTARTHTSRSAPSPLRTHAATRAQPETKQDDRTTCAHFHLRAKINFTE